MKFQTIHPHLAIVERGEKRWERSHRVVRQYIRGSLVSTIEYPTVREAKRALGHVSCTQS